MKHFLFRTCVVVLTLCSFIAYTCKCSRNIPPYPNGIALYVDLRFMGSQPFHGIWIGVYALASVLFALGKVKWFSMSILALTHLCCYTMKNSKKSGINSNQQHILSLLLLTLALHYIYCACKRRQLAPHTSKRMSERQLIEEEEEEETAIDYSRQVFAAYLVLCACTNSWVMLSNSIELLVRKENDSHFFDSVSHMHDTDLFTSSYYIKTLGWRIFCEICFLVYLMSPLLLHSRVKMFIGGMYMLIFQFTTGQLIEILTANRRHLYLKYFNFVYPGLVIILFLDIPYWLEKAYYACQQRSELPRHFKIPTSKHKHRKSMYSAAVLQQLLHYKVLITICILCLAMGEWYPFTKFAWAFRNEPSVTGFAFVTDENGITIPIKSSLGFGVHQLSEGLLSNLREEDFGSNPYVRFEEQPQLKRLAEQYARSVLAEHLREKRMKAEVSLPLYIWWRSFSLDSNGQVTASNNILAQLTANSL